MRISNLLAVTMLVLAAVVGVVSAHAQTYSDLYNFGNKNAGPLQPQAPGIIAQGRDGDVYSTTPDGGTSGLGTVFKITPEDRLAVIYSFDDAHGATPTSGLTLGLGLRATLPQR